MKFPPSRQALLHMAIAAAIAVAAGPDIVAAMELRILLELLGAALFLTVYGVALEYTVRESLPLLRRFLVPVPANALWCGGPALKLEASFRVLINAAGWMLGTFVIVQWCLELAGVISGLR